jgi:transcriptional regulator with XRE-family HTH domain
MPSREGPSDRGRQRGRSQLRDLIGDARRARLEHNLTQSAVGRALGVSDTRVSAIECGAFDAVPFVLIAEYLAVVGLELSARAYPAGGGLREAGQARLLGSFFNLVSPSFIRRTEVPLPVAGDLRAWDATLIKGSLRIGIEAVTRVRDFQSIDRRLMLKLRDAGWERGVLLLAGSRNNRAVIREFGQLVMTNYPIPHRVALRALRDGVDPGGNAIILL